MEKPPVDGRDPQPHMGRARVDRDDMAGRRARAIDRRLAAERSLDLADLCDKPTRRVRRWQADRVGRDRPSASPSWGRVEGPAESSRKIGFRASRQRAVRTLVRTSGLRHSHAALSVVRWLCQKGSDRDYDCKPGRIMAARASREKRRWTVHGQGQGVPSQGTTSRRLLGDALQEHPDTGADSSIWMP